MIKRRYVELCLQVEFEIFFAKKNSDVPYVVRFKIEVLKGVKRG